MLLFFADNSDLIILLKENKATYKINYKVEILAE